MSENAEELVSDFRTKLIRAVKIARQFHEQFQQQKLRLRQERQRSDAVEQENKDVLIKNSLV